MKSTYRIFPHWVFAVLLVGAYARADIALVMRDLTGGSDGNPGSTTEAETIMALTDPTDAYEYTDYSDTRDTINVAGAGSFSPTDTLPNGAASGERYVLRAAANLRIPAGAWTIGFGSDDGGTLNVGGIEFLNTYGTSGTMATNEVRFEGGRGHSWTFGTFTLDAQFDTALDALMFESGGGDSWEIAISEGHSSSFSTASWVLLEDGAKGWTVQVAPIIDSDPPVIEALSPADNSIGAYPAASLVASFDEPIALTSSGTVSIVNLDATTQLDIVLPDARVSASGRKLTIDPDGYLGLGTNYAVQISGNAIGDLWSPPNLFSGITDTVTWNFQTELEDFSAPVLTNTLPAADATGVSPDTALIAMFDDPVVVGMGHIVITNLTDATTEVTIAVTNGSLVSAVGNVLTILPGVVLQGPKTYAVLIDAGAVENYSGLPFAGVSASDVWRFETASKTTYSGAVGAYKKDTWNDAGNWDNGVPGGGLMAEVAAGEYASVSKAYSGVDTPAYTGDLVLGTNAMLEIGESSVAADLNALGGGEIHFHDGSELRMRYPVNSVHDQGFVMLGDATFAIGASTSAHNINRTLAGSIRGPGTLTVHSSNGQRLTIASGTNTSWSGGIVMGGAESESKNESLQATATGAFGSGNVTVDDGVGLRIDAADVIADTATLSLSGGDGEEAFKLRLNADETVQYAFLDGNTLQAGTYGRVGTPATADHEMAWIGGDGVLTVASVPADTTTPSVVSIDSPPAQTPIHGTPAIVYTVTFDEDINGTTVDAGDFGSSGSAPYTIGAVTNISTPPYPAVYTVELIPSGEGTVQFQLSGEIEDLAGNLLPVPVDDDQVYILTDVPSPRGEITVDGYASTNRSASTVTLVLDASESDKLVVVVTGEHGFPNSLSGDCFGVTYDGVALTNAVERNPQAGPPLDQLFNDIWYLDAPGLVHTGGVIVASLVSRASVTAFALSGAAPGVGAVAISPQNAKQVDLITATENSMVIASHGMGGDGNTANVGSVDTVAPLIETSARRNSFYDGHVTGYMMVPSPLQTTPTFVGGYLNGSHTIAAEFAAAPLPPPAGSVLFVK